MKVGKSGWYRTQTVTKRVVSSLLMISLVAAVFSNYVKKEEVYAEVSSGAVTRGVVENVTQLPQYNPTSPGQLLNPYAVRGTAERPFVVLEIVPYEELAEFGYQIGGCEPVNLEKMYGSGSMATIGSLLDADVQMQSGVFFFPDEPEGHVENYENVNSIKEYWSQQTVSGYYEVVEDGTGFYSAVVTTEESETGEGNTPEPQEPAAPVTKVTFEKKENGNLIWHTVNEFEKADYAGIAFDGNPQQRLSELGDRFYTTRTSNLDTDPIMIVFNYYTYRNREHFLLDTLRPELERLGLNESTVSSYSIVIKTITPVELNASVGTAQDWIPYADLISISPKSHDRSLVDIWQKRNRLGHPASEGVDFTSGNLFTNENDISWQSALEIYNKVTAKQNYAGIIVDDGIYNNLSTYDARNVNLDIQDWYMESSGLTDTNITGYRNNIYKLAVMLFSMRPELFHSLYLNGENPIIRDGIDTKQTGDAAEYWNFRTFLTVPPAIDRPADFQSYAYWASEEAWNNYRITPVPSAEGYKNWTSGHVFSYKGDNGILRGDYVNSVLQNVDKFPEFKKYLEENGITNPSPSDAVRFILGLNDQDTPMPEEAETLRILDIEPCVDLGDTALDSNKPLLYPQEWKLTETYIRMLMPTFTGKIEITHQTTAEFNGKIEDLNSTYDMIYLGLDHGAYNNSQQTITLNNGSTIQGDFPDWNDNSMDGMIYTHKGDSAVSTEKNSRSVKFLWDPASNAAINSTEVRFAGNDISKLKCKDLKEFIDAGYPIAASLHLYQLEKKLVDEKSNIYQFVSKYKEAGTDAESGATWTKGVYSISQANEILDALGNLKEEVVFTKLPALYDGSTSRSDATVITNPNYLPRDDAGRPCLEFQFQVKSSGYSYNIYVDNDRNGKFSSEELIWYGTAVEGNNEVTLPLSSSLVGLLQWKIEVYRTDRPADRYMETGCSAAQNNTGHKKTVRVLQIMPDDATNGGALNLETNTLFTKYYGSLADYTITMNSITWNEFAEYFKDSGFHFDLSKPIETNPLEEENQNPVNEDKIDPDAKLSSYNMIIVGFDDMYGKQDFNSVEAVEYLEYFIAQGKSMLFTHDLTSMTNTALGSKYGATANAMLRDVMGMNRFKAVSSRLSAAQRQSLMDYQNLPENDYYDTIDSAATHGFTDFTIKHIASSENNNRMPYRRLSDDEGGFNDYNDQTTQISKLNEGQITTYPFKIDDTFTVANTHAQYYQLNIEDPEVTVWYCLDNCGKESKRGSSLIYGVSPNDAVNSYYIYSKGNVFYSGVGHKTVNNEMETKLFINTMIAAYRASFEPPQFEITNPEAYFDEVQNYYIESVQEFENGETPDTGENIQYKGDFLTPDPVKVTFIPRDYNPVKAKLTGWIYYEDGTYIDTIYRVLDNQPVNADAEHKYENILNGEEYYFYYDKYSSSNVIRFDLKNDRTAQKGTAILTMRAQPMFILD